MTREKFNPINFIIDFNIFKKLIDSIQNIKKEKLLMIYFLLYKANLDNVEKIERCIKNVKENTDIDDYCLNINNIKKALNEEDFVLLNGNYKFDYLFFKYVNGTFDFIENNFNELYHNLMHNFLYSLIEENKFNLLSYLQDFEHVKNKKIDDEVFIFLERLKINNYGLFLNIKKDCNVNKSEIRKEFEKIYIEDGIEDNKISFDEKLVKISNFKNHKRFDKDMKAFNEFYTPKPTYRPNSYYRILKDASVAYHLDSLLYVASFLENDENEGRHNLNTLKNAIIKFAPLEYIDSFKILFNEIKLPNKESDANFEERLSNNDLNGIKDALKGLRFARNKYLAHKDYYFIKNTEAFNNLFVFLFEKDNLFKIIELILDVGDLTYNLVTEENCDYEVMRDLKKKFLYKKDDLPSQVSHLKKDLGMLIEVYIRNYENEILKNEKVKILPGLEILRLSKNEFSKIFSKYGIIAFFDKNFTVLEIDKKILKSEKDLLSLIEECKSFINKA